MKEQEVILEQAVKIGDVVVTPIMYIEEVEEPEFGCEGRPEGVTVYGSITLHTKREKIMCKVEEKLLWYCALDNDMYIGYRMENSKKQYVFWRNGKDNLQPVNDTIMKIDAIRNNM